MKSQIVPMTAEQYHADENGPTLSNSIAQVLLSQSPLHAWMAHPKLNPNYHSAEDSRFDLGRAAHALLLEGNNAKIAIVDAADWRTKAAKEARDQARANGLLPILAKHDFALKAMVKAAREYVAGSELKGIFDNGKPEQTIFWDADGVACRSRLDWLTNDYGIILDYKTTANAHPEAFTRQIGAMGYDMQACFYARAVSAACNVDPAFAFLVQEIEPPYACSLVGLSNAYYELAEAKVDRAMDLWFQCMRTDKWPAYPDRVAYAEPPAWALNEHMAMMEQQAQEEV
jgi:hypothetical protein